MSIDVKLFQLNTEDIVFENMPWYIIYIERVFYFVVKLCANFKYHETFAHSILDEFCRWCYDKDIV